MNIRLSEEQRHALQASADQPLPVEDEQSRKVYYLLNEEAFLHLQGLQSENEQQCSLLTHFPQLGSRREDLAERLRLFTYRGYGIYYRDLSDRVRIERVLHPSLDAGTQSF